MQSSVVSRPITNANLLHYSVGMPHAMFEAWVDCFPESAAVTSESITLTYAEVEQRANRIAHALRSAGVQRGNLVGIFLERGPDLVCALLGILKSGAAFAAFDPQAPKESLARIFAAVECPYLLTRSGLTTCLPTTSSQLFKLDDYEWLESQPVSRPVSQPNVDDPACVLFTSGSTGKPKAVLYLQRNLAARFANSIEVSGFDRFGIFAQTSPVTSIDAMDEIFLPLMSGGCTYVLTHETVMNPHQLIDCLAAQRVTHMLLVPSLLRVILAAEENLDRKLSALGTWMIGGEPLSIALTRDFYKALPAAMLINYYGLTEGDVCCHITSPEFKYMTNVPIGRPVRNTKVYLLDERLCPVPAGKPGEICVSGEGLSHAYVNCPEFNAERWVSNPFETDAAYARLFRTGDMGRIRYDGEIEYLGRRDRMVKVNGFRVELGEVETVLFQHLAVDQCVVVARQPADDGQASRAHQTQLVAYVILKRGEKTASHELRDFLRCHLPEFAVPSAVMVLNAFPLTPNGKVDIQALPEPDAAARRSQKNCAAPRDVVEQKLVYLWENLLGLHPIGIYDSFFEMGGDSLTAMDLMLTIEKEFKCSLPIVVLFQSPTIAALAEIVRENGKSVSQDSLVPLRTQGSRPPLFCVHADGSVFIYRHFEKYLGSGIPIYGLQAHGLANPKHDPYEHIDEMAAHYIAEIRMVQPHGPYHLCAFSAGGFIIFEMARRLRAMGETVAFVGMLDAYGPGYPERLGSQNVADYKIAVHLNTLRLLGAKGQLQYLWGRVRHRTGLILSKQFSKLLMKLQIPLPRRIRYEYIASLIDRAGEMYPAGQTYAGDVTIFHALTQPEGIKADPALGWANIVTGELKILDVPGTHNSVMMHEPHVADLVRKINEHLDQLQNTTP